MIQKFLLIGYVDQKLVSEAYLASDGVKTEESHFVVGKHHGTYDTYDEAHDEMKKIKEQPELGFDIKPVFVKP